MLVPQGECSAQYHARGMGHAEGPVAYRKKSRWKDSASAQVVGAAPFVSGASKPERAPVRSRACAQCQPARQPGLERAVLLCTPVAPLSACITSDTQQPAASQENEQGHTDPHSQVSLWEPGVVMNLT